MARSMEEALAYLAPERLYSLRGFQAAGGISATRVREARRKGIVLPIIEVGRRKFVRGNDAILYLLRLAELTAVEKAAAAKGQR